MLEDRQAKMKERDAAMRKARDEILLRVRSWLLEQGFVTAGSGHFTRPFNGWLGHVGFQKHRSGRNVRILCHIDLNDAAGTRMIGPISDLYERPNSPNGKKYHFGWSTRDSDIEGCANEYCRYISDVVVVWLANPSELA